MVRTKTVATFTLLSMGLTWLVLHLVMMRSLEQSFDFGAAFGSSRLEHSFRTFNFSFSTLVVHDVSSSCGCTVVNELPPIIRPFESVAIPVRMDVSEKRGHTSAQVVVQFTNGDAAKYSLFAEVYPALPEVVELGRVKSGESIEREFVLDGTQAKRLSSLKFVPVDGVEFGLSQLKAQTIAKLTFTPSSQDKGAIDRVLAFASSSGVQSELVVRAFVAAPVEATHSVVSLGYLAPEAKVGQAKPVQFYSPYGYTFRWLRDETRHPAWLQFVQDDPQKPEVDVSFTSPP